MIRAAVVSLCLVWAGAPGADPLEKAAEAAAQMRAAADALAKANGADDRIAALTETVRAYETGLASVRTAMREAEIREQALQQGFAAEREKLARLVGVLATLEATPKPVFLLHPDGPLGSARAGMMVSDLTPAVAAEAQDLKARLEELKLIRDAQITSRELLAEGLRSAQAARVELADAIDRRIALPDRVRPDPALLRRLVESSDSLAGFAAGLASLPKPDAPFGFSAQKGRLPLPVPAQILRAYNERDPAGIARPGLVLATQPRALVTAPAAATIRYIGPLLDYGIVIVLEPEQDILLVLAGLADTYGEVGDVVAAGAPLGLMPGEVALPTVTGQTRRETLYLELRQGGSPLDPTLWFLTERT